MKSRRCAVLFLFSVVLAAWADQATAETRIIKWAALGGVMTATGDVSTSSSQNTPDRPAITPASKSKASGIMCLLNGDTLTGVPDLSAEPGFKNPAVRGIVLRAHWDKIEPVEGSIDWSFFDQGISLAQKNGKIVSLEVVAGSHTPGWVLAAGAKSLILTTPHTGAVQPVPLPWDTVYLTQWSDFITAFANRYDSSPAVAYVTMTGAGRGDEVHFATTPEDAGKLARLGGASAWLAGAEKIVDIYGKAFVHTPFILATGRPVPGPAGKKALTDLIQYGLSNYPQFGFAPHELWSNSDGSGTVPQLMAEVSANHTVGFQMFFAIQNSRTFAGSLDQVLNVGIGSGAHFIEVYAADIDDPANQAVLEKANSDLVAKFGL